MREAAAMAKTEGQKFKSLLVAKYLMENCDEDSPVWMNDILDYLEDEIGNPADRRSVYRDIEALRQELGWEIEEEKIGRDMKYTLLSRPFAFDDLRLLAECVYAAKFVSERKAKDMVKAIGQFGTLEQADRLEGETVLADRARTTQTGTMNIISTIKSAMAKRVEGKSVEPRKITFNYLQYDIDNLEEMKERRRGARYIVSPYRLIINDGYYYLLGYDDEYQKMMTFRIDRMKNVKVFDEPRDGEEAFEEMNVKGLTKRVFGMYRGEPVRVSLLCLHTLLDTMVDKFGLGGDTFYRKEDKDFFVVTADVEISEQFYGWLLGFGKRVKIIAPDSAVEDFKAYLDKIRENY